MIKRVFGFYSLPLRILTSPIKGFYEMKFEEKGTLRLAIINFLLLSVSMAFMNQYSSVLVNPRHPLWMNSIFDFAQNTLVLILFCASNWAVTSLTDGEGKFKEILMTVCYAMTPLVLILIPATLFSNILSQQETAFFHLIVSFGVFWFVVLVFVGLIVIHDYTVGKAIVTAFLTFFSLIIIVFLITLVFTLVQQLYVFVISIYREISFRL